MSLKSLSPFPFPFHRPSPPLPSTSRRPPTVIRLSRWNNANAEPFLHRRRHQHEIEADLRLHRRLDSAARLTSLPSSPSSPPSSSPHTFKSNGTPSSPSSPSIPGKASKYSKPLLKPKKPRVPYVNPKSVDLSHPAFRLIQKRAIRRPVESVAESESSPIVVGENGMSYRFENMPFEFQYSYTETPKVKPLAFREPPYMPFGPRTMPRPWTGRAPLPASKKKLPEFDSFKPPPAGKKGVKPVQNPGPFLPGSGPRYAARTREEVLGEPLTEEELKSMVQAGMKTTRQLNMGRDGLTHNMLENIHAHWKRRRVCKIKCKGVCTVDMDNVRQQLEEKTGGKVIYSRGGVIFLFRGRNYNYKSRPRFPLMLWKPAPPIYPRLVQRAPEGLTLEEATEMRKRGRELPPICSLGKNGVYINLVQNVREAFEGCELVRINCKGLHKSDCRKIGAKLKDLVPCILISFEYEHVLMWRGKDWQSSLPPLKDSNTESGELGVSSVGNLSGNDACVSSSNLSTALPVNQQELPDKDFSDEESDDETNLQFLTTSYGDFSYYGGENVVNGPHQDPTDISVEIAMDDSNTSVVEGGSSSVLEYAPLPDINLQAIEDPVHTPETVAVNGFSTVEGEGAGTPESEALSGVHQMPYLDGVMDLLKQAIENGSAVILNDDSLDANIVFERAIDLAKRAPPGPVFTHTTKKIATQKVAKPKKKGSGHEVVEVEIEKIVEMDYPAEKSAKSRRKDSLKEAFSDVIPRGSLRVDELAKLLTS